ncbi:hypothetical protein MRO89_11110 [Dickeya dianthicola]|uniref:hypothetical protein n=1 Tax=Dickeya dianthicola TaxID=204039 RepID=UPI001F6093F0|nr:hypothetical protein [Dickeya dianthicola]MCI4186511.1 hypothetical protein [Dickeya dianthicola]
MKKYVKAAAALTSVLLFSGIAEAKDENMYPGLSYLANASGYCADVYRKDGRAFSNNQMHIYIANVTGDYIPTNHPVYLDVDFYKDDKRDSNVATVPCHGELYKKRSKHLKIDLPLAALNTDDAR